MRGTHGMLASATLLCLFAPPMVALTTHPQLVVHPRLHGSVRPRAASRHAQPRAEGDFTEVQRLRAEVESPFSQVRLFAFVRDRSIELAPFGIALSLLIAVAPRSIPALTSLTSHVRSPVSSPYSLRRRVLPRTLEAPACSLAASACASPRPQACRICSLTLPAWVRLATSGGARHKCVTRG